MRQSASKHSLLLHQILKVTQTVQSILISTLIQLQINSNAKCVVKVVDNVMNTNVSYVKKIWN
jgi:hypothetical protein